MWRRKDEEKTEARSNGRRRRRTKKIKQAKKEKRIKWVTIKQE